MELVDRREEVCWLRGNYPASQQRVCGLMEIAVSSFRHRSRRSEEELREQLLDLARRTPRFGYRRLHILLGGGERVNHKRVFRVYREAGLAVRRKARKRLVREGSPRRALTAANQEWAVDFAHDAIAGGRAIRVLSVVDECTRECLALEVDTSFASRRVTRALEAILEEREKPLTIRCDNGPEFSSRHFLVWCIERGIELVHIQPGKPQHNGYVESFHGKLRDECLNVSWFENLWDARRKEFNEERPHSALRYLTRPNSRGNYRLPPAPRYASGRCPLTECACRMIHPADLGGRSAGVESRIPKIRRLRVGAGAHRAGNGERPTTV